MPLTITVKEPLARELQSAADLHKISVEQYALEVLGQAVQKQEWPDTNRRRVALIRQQFAAGLTAAETAELQELQRQVDRQLESLDAAMLNDITHMEQAAAEALDGATH